MIKELQNGPMACGVEVTDAFENYTGGIFDDKTGAGANIDHGISVVGYGVENGTKYWLIRNSWGSMWGEHGFVKLVRGVNNLGIESENNC
jgi:cathepsin X